MLYQPKFVKLLFVVDDTNSYEFSPNYLELDVGVKSSTKNSITYKDLGNK